uniref:Uncharacterized protein n=1 Tax=Siphoviridae sp. ctabX13 TaxID=2826389 RepID=A0A8S5LWV2_9CAUD|nr:MAG TPA: hypothetical protein [Siphoviridae sp. ctabX13]
MEIYNYTNYRLVKQPSKIITGLKINLNSKEEVRQWNLMEIW